MSLLAAFTLTSTVSARRPQLLRSQGHRPYGRTVSGKAWSRQVAQRIEPARCSLGRRPGGRPGSAAPSAKPWRGQVVRFGAPWLNTTCSGPPTGPAAAGPGSPRRAASPGRCRRWPGWRGLTRRAPSPRTTQDHRAWWAGCDRDRGAVHPWRTVRLERTGVPSAFSTGRTVPCVQTRSALVEAIRWQGTGFNRSRPR